MAKVTMESKVMALASLTEHPKNPNMHPKEQIEDIAKSIKEYGQYYPIIIDETGLILAGHGKKKALELLGRTEGDCIVMHGLNEKQKMKLLLSDNKIQSFSFLNHTIDDEHEYYLWVVDNSNSDSVESVQINYCPVCGRKLT